MAPEGSKYHDITIRPIGEAEDVRKLNKYLSKFGAGVSHQLRDGKVVYEPGDDGQYNVRSHVPLFLGAVRETIEGSRYHVTRVVEMPEGVEISLPPRRM